VIGGVLASLLATKSATPSAQARAAISRALYLTVAERSYSFTMKESLDLKGSPVSININANGTCSLNSSLCGFTLALDGITVTAVSKDGTVYEKVPPNDPISAPTPWVSAPLGSAVTTTSGTTSSTSMAGPLSELTTLANEGAEVSSGGSATLYGQRVSVYNVTFSKTVSQSLAKSSLKKYPAWLRKETANVSLGAIKETVDVGASGRLVAILATSSEESHGQQVTVTITEHITGYGMPVIAVVPPANEVTPISKLNTSAA
jgi:hypothetical protein